MNRGRGALVRTELASSQTTIDLGGIDFAGSAQGDAVRTIQRRGSAPDPCPVRRKGVHARNLIGDEDDPAVAFAELVTVKVVVAASPTVKLAEVPVAKP